MRSRRSSSTGAVGPPTCSALATFVLAAALAALAAGIPMSERVVCHVCGGADAGRDLFPGLPLPPSCLADQHTELECPPKYKGCLTTYNGLTLTRTCGERAYDPCEVANGVVYCYCSGRLCNSQTEEQMRLQRCAGALLRRHVPEDDEDAVSDTGSGSGELPHHFDDCLPPTTARPDPVTADPAAPKASTDAPKAADAATEDDANADADDLDWDGVGTTMESNTTAQADGSGSGDAHRAHSSVVCVLAAVLVALWGWSGAEHHRH